MKASESIPNYRSGLRMYANFAARTIKKVCKEIGPREAGTQAELDAQKDAEFSKYETLLGDDVDFIALKERKSELTVKEIEGECAIMYTRKHLAQGNFSKSNNGVMTAGLIDDSGKDGFVETKYGYIKTKR